MKRLSVSFIKKPTIIAVHSLVLQTRLTPARHAIQ